MKCIEVGLAMDEISWVLISKTITEEYEMRKPKKAQLRTAQNSTRSPAQNGSYSRALDAV